MRCISFSFAALKEGTKIGRKKLQTGDLWPKTYGTGTKKFLLVYITKDYHQC